MLGFRFEQSFTHFLSKFYCILELVQRHISIKTITKLTKTSKNSMFCAFTPFSETYSLCKYSLKVEIFINAIFIQRRIKKKMKICILQRHLYLIALN